jgi:hypothetical protein
LHKVHLGKQRAEVITILNVLHEVAPASGVLYSMQIQNHPAIKMWRGYAVQLCEYGLVMCEEWIKRGYRDVTAKSQIEWHMDMATSGAFTMEKPPWLGDEALHLSHRSNLLRKMPSHYRNFWPDDPDNLQYVWPV